MPIKFGLIGPNGSPMSWSEVSGGDVRDDLIVLDSDQRRRSTFKGVPNRPVPSLFRGFSAPVKLVSQCQRRTTSCSSRGTTATRSTAGRRCRTSAMALMVDAVGGTPWSDAQVDALRRGARGHAAPAKTLDPAFKALALSLPDEQLIAPRPSAAMSIPTGSTRCGSELIGAVVAPLAPTLEAIYRDQLTSAAPTRPTPAAVGPARAAATRRSACWSLGEAAGGAALAREQYEQATNMTDRFAALAAVGRRLDRRTPRRCSATSARMFTADPLVLDKWLALNAMAPRRRRHRPHQGDPRRSRLSRRTIPTGCARWSAPSA